MPRNESIRSGTVCSTIAHSVRIGLLQPKTLFYQQLPRTTSGRRLRSATYSEQFTIVQTNAASVVGYYRVAANIQSRRALES